MMCGPKLVARSNGNPGGIVTRLPEYYEKTNPIIKASHEVDCVSVELRIAML
jgi:hypothetical protein